MSLAGATLDKKLRDFLSEDIGATDVTTEWTVPRGTRASGRLLAKSDCVVSGLPIARRTFELLDPAVGWEGEIPAGSAASAGTILARIEGAAQSILTGERVSLNLLQRMCGIATLTRHYVEAVAGTACRVLDTRKTAPGLRAFDRAAVRDGGGSNHRERLSDLVLIKDNHRRLAGGVSAALALARAAATPGMRTEVEVETEAELDEALAGGADAILIDNQEPDTVADWVRRARSIQPSIFIEASGNVGLDNAALYARAGVDAISVGALTHSVRAADVSLELELR